MLFKYTARVCLQKALYMTDTTVAPVIAQTLEGVSAFPTINGQGQAGATINLSIDGTLVTDGPSIVVADDGHWTYTPVSALPLFLNTASATQSVGDVTSPVSNVDSFMVAPVVNLLGDTQQLTPVHDAVSLSPVVECRHGVFRLTGTASSTTGVPEVQISASVHGVREILGTAAVAADGTFSFNDKVGANPQSHLTAMVVDAAGGTASTSASFTLRSIGGRQDGVVGEQTVHAADGSTVLSRSLFHDHGERLVDVASPGQTITATPFDVFVNHHEIDTHFVFRASEGCDVIHGFTPGGSGHDTLVLPAADFASIADVLRHTVDAGSSALIIDPSAGDTIRLAGVSTAQLKAHPGDFLLSTGPA